MRRRLGWGRGLARAAGLVALAWFSVVAAGCGSELQDRTPPRTVYAPPSNVQFFAAGVTPASGRFITEVVLETDGTSAPMTNAFGDHWEQSVLLPRCDEIVPYRFLVYSGPDDPRQVEVFPALGWFTRLITDQPAACDNVPGQRTSIFTVNTTDDVTDAVPGDGFCSTTQDPTAPESRCSLRAAVMEANHKPGLDAIVLGTREYRLSLVGPESDDIPNEAVGDLDITDSVSIESTEARGGCPGSIADFLDPRTYGYVGGPSAVAHIDGNWIDRVFDVYTGPVPRRTEVYLSCLHVFGGQITNDTGAPRRHGGGVMNRGIMVMDHVVMRLNAAFGDTAGAAISNSGHLMIQDSLLLQNFASTLGATTIFTEGGALYNGGGATATIERSALLHNRADFGAGIANGVGATVTVVNSTLAENNGGSFLAGEAPSAIWSRGTLNVAWSTLRAGRRALSSTGVTRVLNSIVLSQSAVVDGRQLACNDGLAPDATTIGVRTTDEDCIARVWRGTANNVVQDPLRGVADWYTGAQMRGGFTPVLPLTRPSPGDPRPEEFAIDTALAPAGCPATDQRGLPRPVAAPETCDPGAMELQPGEL